MRARRFLLSLMLVFVGVAASGQTPATGRVMRTKLTHAQKMLEAILVSDVALLEHESTALLRATELPGWAVLKSPEYAGYSAAFIRAVQDVVDAAKQRDLDAAATRYAALTMSCYQCHRYLKDTRIAQKEKRKP